MRPKLRAKPRSTRRPASDSRAWAVAQDLRAHRGWLLDHAHLHRSWSVRFGAATFEISAFVSLFFDGPCFIQITWTFPKAMTRAIGEDVIRHLRAALGERYRGDPTRGSIVAAVRADKPTRLLAEIAHVERVLGGRALRRFGPVPRSQDRRHWYVAEALRASSWLIYVLNFSRKIGDEQRQLWASIGVGLDSAGGRPGLAASFAAWVPRTTKRWTRFCDDTAAGLTSDGFRISRPKPWVFYAGGWVAGTHGARASRLADELDGLLDGGADIVIG